VGLRRLRWLVLGLLLWAPVTWAGTPAPPPGAAEGAYRGECRRMTRQIAYYAQVVDMARERDNEAWEEATLQHIGRLTTRRAYLCPQEYADKKYGEALLKLLRLAGKVALKMFTWGLI